MSQYVFARGVVNAYGSIAYDGRQIAVVNGIHAIAPLTDSDRAEIALVGAFDDTVDVLPFVYGYGDFVRHHDLCAIGDGPVDLAKGGNGSVGGDTWQCTVTFFCNASSVPEGPRIAEVRAEISL
jgi:hypothetical protein